MAGMTAFLTLLAYMLEPYDGESPEVTGRLAAQVGTRIDVMGRTRGRNNGIADETG